MTRPEFEPWIAHNGGPCPFEPDDLVQVQSYNELRGDVEDSAPVAASAIVWEYRGVYADIIAARRVKVPARHRLIMWVDALGYLRFKPPPHTPELPTNSRAYTLTYEIEDRRPVNIRVEPL